jgi:hypothetical protein
MACVWSTRPQDTQLDRFVPLEFVLRLPPWNGQALASAGAGVSSGDLVREYRRS